MNGRAALALPGGTRSRLGHGVMPMFSARIKNTF